MGRPTAAKQQEIQDTLYWCECISAYSGITVDAEIGRILNYPDGKNFGRWKKGERAPTTTGLQMLVRTAREKGLLPKAGIIRNLQEKRLYLDAKNRYAKDEIDERAAALKQLTETRTECVNALRAYSNAVRNASYVAVLDTLKLDFDGNPSEVNSADLLAAARYVENHVFLPLG